mmetsp:Transcript_21065/g.25037  ORF Transcript_21065/g.25037 Transcript_21065/m.25037 type:complete len:174 (-) Transcript_21065:37-558(-)|eukprot:CAMPEP_0198251260 /NCGR_PEP_ID=MMETSP1447-20131203/2150_1 /TAXON_ID=420782 /ORGANISM="Chaetoceros dichaeta, Strain CCMP1751" /LENGTH=173 /DNA_ID=CAMNT_0043936237 /DNA_START=53 /DNA_END=574 /DNA_ORIENTATION=+
MPKKQPKKTVKVVVAPTSSFPDFSQFDSSSTQRGSNRRTQNNYNDDTRTKKKKGSYLDFDETVREVYELGSTKFAGKQKRDYENEQYTTLTGRQRKKQKIPVKIVRGIKKAAAVRETRVEKETKEAGIVTANKRGGTTKKRFSEKVRKASQLHGPAPSIGYLKKGVLTVKRDS